MNKKKRMMIQQKRNYNWRKTHRWHARQISYRGTAKTFIRDGYATINDLKTIIKLCKHQLNGLKNQDNK